MLRALYAFYLFMREDRILLTAERRAMMLRGDR